MPAPLTILGQKLFGKAFNGAGRAIANSGLNPGLWAEELGRTILGRTTRNPAQRLVSAAVKGKVGRPAVPPTPAGWNIATGTQTPATAGSPAVRGVRAKPAVYADVNWEDQPLTASGKTLQTLGVLGGAGTLGYQMLKGDGTEGSHDQNGVKNPAHNEEMAKFRSKFQQDKLGGDKLFSPSKYMAMRQQGAWVNTAIEQIGKENYIRLKQQLSNGEIDAAKMHSILTDAIAEMGDEETLKQAGSQPYVLPGLVSKGDKKRVIVMAPMKSPKGKDVTMQAMHYGIHEDENGGEQPQQ